MVGVATSGPRVVLLVTAAVAVGVSVDSTVGVQTLVRDVVGVGVPVVV
jgi:hypothetical protein